MYVDAHRVKYLRSNAPIIYSTTRALCHVGTFAAVDAVGSV